MLKQRKIQPHDTDQKTIDGHLALTSKWKPGLHRHGESANSFTQPVQIKAPLLSSCWFATAAALVKAALVLAA